MGRFKQTSPEVDCEVVTGFDDSASTHMKNRGVGVKVRPQVTQWNQLLRGR